MRELRRKTILIHPQVWVCALSCVLGATVLPSVIAAPVTFGQFTEAIGGNDFTFTDPGVPGGTATFSASTQVNFIYQNVNNLPSDLQGQQSATLTLTSSTSVAATQVGNIIDQPISGGATTNTLSIIRNTPAGSGGTNLLTVTFDNNGDIFGSGGSTSATYSSASSPPISFTSDFLNFSGVNTEAFSLSLSSLTDVNPLASGLTIDNISGFLNSFSAASSGTFSSSPAPASTPEPDTVIMFGVGLVGLAGWTWRRRKGSEGVALPSSL